IALLSELCVELDDREHAPLLEELLLPLAERNVVSPEGFFAGPVSRYLALLAITRRDWAVAAERLHLPPTTALVDLDEALLLLRRDEPGDRDRARRLVADARAVAAELGADGIVGRAERLAAELGGGAAPPVAAPD